MLERIRAIISSMGLLRDYANQARTYDETRSAAPAIVAALRAALAGAPGRRLADVGGGTGNYGRALAAAGWDVLVVDRSEPMLARARAKGLATLRGDAERLPLADATFDGVTMVSMLHHVDAAAALSEAARVLRPGGRLAVLAYAQEDLEHLPFSELFPSSRAWMAMNHPPLAELLALLPGAERTALVNDDLRDASLAVLASHPELVLEERWRRQTSYFERMERDHPDELAAGLERLRADVAAGRAPRRPGTLSVLEWTRPPDYAASTASSRDAS